MARSSSVPHRCLSRVESKTPDGMEASQGLLDSWIRVLARLWPIEAQRSTSMQIKMGERNGERGPRLAIAVSRSEWREIGRTVALDAREQVDLPRQIFVH